MKLREIVSFREDLLFDGAVQLGWLEEDPDTAARAARHFVFHGPHYHGAAQKDFEDHSHLLVDTASLTLDVVERICGKARVAEEPFALAIAGYGAGKSHLAITLSTLLSEPKADTAEKILANLEMVDANIGRKVRATLAQINQPFLVVAINGMKDFNLSNEIIRQVLLKIQQRKLDTSALENLRPRFDIAANFVESFFNPLQDRFEDLFGGQVGPEEIVARLRYQDEDAFRKVSNIYEEKMRSPIPISGQESLQDFVRAAKETYCGPGKPFTGILILFDEFGRYMEFAVQKPHIAGPGGLQQLFECVQANRDRVFLLGFIQYELKAYISRVAPEHLNDLNRYVTRYENARKLRLSTNLETLIANLLEKKHPEEIGRQLAGLNRSPAAIQAAMKAWLPDLKNHAIWTDLERFEKVIVEGCWPLHPLSTWLLYKLTSVGKSLQQRSAFSLLKGVYASLEEKEFKRGRTIRPVELCNQDLIDEFLASEKNEHSRAIAHAYQGALQKHPSGLSQEESQILKAVLLSTKIGSAVKSKENCHQLLAMLTGLEYGTVEEACRSLENEHGILAWKEAAGAYEIVEDAVPKREFDAYLERKAKAVDQAARTEIFADKYKQWFKAKEIENTDFGGDKGIRTKDWGYRVYFSNVNKLKNSIDTALQCWKDALAADEPKGQLIYCYVGPESDINEVKENATKMLKDAMHQLKLTLGAGVPLAIFFLNDQEGKLGQKLAKYWVLEEKMTNQEKDRYAAFIARHRTELLEDMETLLNSLQQDRQAIFATSKRIKGSRQPDILWELFSAVYPTPLPFPFDGFGTARGNAAKDCESFTRELFLGNLDRDWISAQNQERRNRAYSVLEKEWGILDEDGSVRMNPSHRIVNQVIEMLENLLPEDSPSPDHAPMNLGEAIRLLCAPPYGCNIASAGMILALFIGRRKGELQLYKKNGEAIDSSQWGDWLGKAIPNRFFDLGVLDETEVVRVSKQELSQWEALLEKWESQVTLEGKVEFQKQAQILKQTLPLPNELHYRYKSLAQDAEHASQQLSEYQTKLDEALEKTSQGVQTGNAGRISWGAADLAKLAREITGKEWTREQVQTVESHLADARAQVQEAFPKWLKRRTVSDPSELGKFRFYMLRQIGGNLDELGLSEEKELLQVHVAQVEKHLNQIAEMRSLTSAVESLVRNRIIPDSTQVAALKNWLEQAGKLAATLEMLRASTDIIKDDLFTANLKLTEFRQVCQDQLAQYRERVTDIYNLRPIASLQDIRNWREEVSHLIFIYSGEARDAEDLKQVQRQLALAEQHYRELEDESLSQDQFGEACQEKRIAAQNSFADDVPPLDNNELYASLAKAIKAKRERVATDWMQRNVPALQLIAGFDASLALEYRNRLQNMPQMLSPDQIKTVNSALAACEKRLDELEVEGLLTRFNALPDEGKKAFLNRISDYIAAFTPAKKKLWWQA